MDFNKVQNEQIKLDTGAPNIHHNPFGVLKPLTGLAIAFLCKKFRTPLRLFGGYYEKVVFRLHIAFKLMGIII